MTGPDLRNSRQALKLKAKDVAAVAKWSPQRISQIEALWSPSAEDVSRYFAALATLTTNSAERSA